MAQRPVCSPANSPVVHKHVVRSNGLFVVGPLICADHRGSLCNSSLRFVYGKKGRTHSLNGARFVCRPLAYAILQNPEWVLCKCNITDRKSLFYYILLKNMSRCERQSAIGNLVTFLLKNVYSGKNLIL